jgi:hypothetical protein
MWTMTAQNTVEAAVSAAREDQNKPFFESQTPAMFEGPMTFLRLLLFLPSIP